MSNNPVTQPDSRVLFRAAREDAVFFDLSDRIHVELTGSDRARFLHNFCTNDIKRLQPGQGCEAFVTSVQGKVLAHLFVFVAPDSLWIDSTPGSEDLLVAHLDKYLITEDVEIVRRSAEFGEVLVTGPRAAERLGEAGCDVSALQSFEHRMCELGGIRVAVRRVDLLGAPGYLLLVGRDSLDALKNLLASRLPQGEVELFHMLRIEAGFPLYGIDISDNNLAQEVNRTAEAISFTKGCYLGQEPIARIDALGHVNQELRRLRFESGSVPAPGTPLVTDTPDAKPAGIITSSSLSFMDDRPIALAYVRRHSLAAGTRLRWQTGEESHVGVVES